MDGGMYALSSVAELDLMGYEEKNQLYARQRRC